ncbi:MAG: ExbD/TolR family protein [Akkermansiaceae bacterium]
MASKKLRAQAGATDDELAVDMSPMIDMVFLLLIFFIVASTAIIVKQDPEVKPPVADNSKAAKDGKGRIVINVRDDGSFWDEKGIMELKDKFLMTKYIEELKDAEEARGRLPVIHLRGDKEVTFKYVRTVIRAAADAKVDNVIFSVFGFDL